MKIVTLLDDKPSDEKLSNTHGLSLYIETKDKKLLFDLGPNNYYKKNAKKLGIDLNDVDYLVISHGHNDHGTGIKQFLKSNKKCEAYVSKRAFEDHVKRNGRQYDDIGIGKAPKSDRIHFVNREKLELSDTIFICDKVDFKKPPIGDDNLMIYEDGQYIEDHFHHEIYVVIKEEDNVVLITGCSHKGIDNIVESIENNMKGKITHIVGGLHFTHYDTFNLRQTDHLQKIGDKFTKQRNMNVFACHCTGDDAYFELKQTMRDNLHQLNTGSIINI